jgi:hypothetical protein
MKINPALVCAAFVLFHSTPSFGAARSCPFELAQNGTSVLQQGPYHLMPIHNYDETLEAFVAGPYDYDQLPAYDILNFDYRNLEFRVGNRSRDILVERHVILPEPVLKPIHPMGIPIAALPLFLEQAERSIRMFSKGAFPILGRFSISQDNPLRYEPLSRWRRLRGLGPKPQVRSVTMGLLLFDPEVEASAPLPIVSLVLQNDLNGKINAETGEADYFLQENVLNKPEFKPGLLLPPHGRIYHWGTLFGVFFGPYKVTLNK